MRRDSICIIGWDNLIQTEFVKKTLLASCPLTHHQPVSAAVALKKRNHCLIQISTDFCNTIGTNRKCHRRPATSAFGGLTDVRIVVADFRV